MKVPQKIFFVEASVFIALILCSTHIFALKDAATIVAGFTVAYLVPRLAYSRMSYRSTLGVAALACAWLVMGILGINYIARATVYTGHSLMHPALWNDADRYFNYALHLFNHQSYDHGLDPFPGLPLMTVMLWKVFSINIVYPLAMNMMLTLATIILTGTFATRLLDGRTTFSNCKVASLAMAMTASLFFFLSHGTQLLKEPLTYFGVMVCALALSSFNRKHCSRLAWRPIALFALGITVVAAARTTYSLIILIGIVLAWAGNRSLWRNAITMLVIGVAVYIGINELSHSITFNHYDTYFDPGKSSAMSYQFIIGDNQAALGSVVGNYFSLEWWQKALWLPFTCAVQYLIPFPWILGRVSISEVVPRIAVTWYAIGGLTLFYIGWMSWRRATSLGWFPLWAIICFAVPAYITAGSVSRYMLPFQPLMIPMAIFVVASLREHKLRKNFTIFATAYIVVLATTLTVCYFVQTSNLQ
ncbi:MAG: hypothetical protein ACI4AH_00195 [Muribaculaceae bacterium]